jgi:hypothetical protein
LVQSCHIDFPNTECSQTWPPKMVIRMFGPKWFRVGYLRSAKWADVQRQMQGDEFEYFFLAKLSPNGCSSFTKCCVGHAERAF